jgi:hypothetical protein
VDGCGESGIGKGGEDSHETKAEAKLEVKLERSLGWLQCTYHELPRKKEWNV